MTRSTREQWEQRIRKWQSSGMDAASSAAREGFKPERRLHHSHSLLIQGDSYRLRQKRKAGSLGHSVPPTIEG